MYMLPDRPYDYPIGSGRCCGGIVVGAHLMC